MKILVDMNLSPAWVKFLSEEGYQSVHWSEIGSGGETDTELMLWAADNRHIVLTADLDFGAILAASKKRQPSIVLIRSDLLTPQTLGHTVVMALRQARKDLTEGAILSIDAVRARLRILPLK